MRKKITAASTAMMALVAMAPMPASAYHHERVYHGRSGYYHHRCGGGNGAVGTVAGGAGGAILGSALGGGTLGVVAGGVGGALLGRHFDKVHTRHRRGC